MDLEDIGNNQGRRLFPEEKYMIAKCNAENLSEDYIPNVRLRAHCGKGGFIPTLYKKMCGGADMRSLQIFNTVYTIVYLVVHTGFTALYQNFRCQNKGTDKKCDDGFLPFAHKAGDDFDLLPTVIAFLMGFYVNMVCVRWWDQISLLPDTDNVSLYLATYMNGDNPEAELKLKKKILRYLNLSWVLAMSRVSSCMYEHFPDEAAYIEKKLVTKEEADEMKLSGPYNKRSSHWFVPLDRAVAAIGVGYNESLFPVYPEQLVKEVVQYRKDLQTLLDYNSSPLPSIFSQTVGLVIVFWGLLGVLKVNDSEKMFEAKDYFFNLPLFRLLTLGMLLNWYIVCLKLLNPFGSDSGYDVVLPEELDINIWKSSVMIWKQDTMRTKKKESTGGVYDVKTFLGFTD